jgi:NADPH-dependent curcumin reductase CurA
MSNAQVRLKRTPAGLPTPQDFELVAAPAPRLSNGGFLCRARWLAIDPVAPARARPGEVVPALGVCEVIESRHDVFSTGDSVVVECGLQQWFTSDGSGVRALHPGQTPASTALGILGPPGLAAYFGLLDVAALRSGETVLVSAAANAAGSMAGQVALIKGARAIGIAGSREKCEWATRHARFAACINYRTESVSARLKQLAPRGVNVFFDNTGGELLESILAADHLVQGGRVVLNTAGHEVPAPQAAVSETDAEAHGTRVLRFSLDRYRPRREEFLKDAIAWYGAGRIVYKDDVTEGLESAPLQLFKAARGENFGRPLVKL